MAQGVGTAGRAGSGTAAGRFRLRQLSPCRSGGGRDYRRRAAYRKSGRDCGRRRQRLSERGAQHEYVVREVKLFTD